MREGWCVPFKYGSCRVWVGRERKARKVGCMGRECLLFSCQSCPMSATNVRGEMKEK